MSSIRDVAKLAGVSLGTVSRYLNGQQLKQGNMEKIAAAIEELDYKENIIAKGLKNNKSFSIGLLMNSISSRFGSEVVSGIEKIAETNGYSLLLSGFSEGHNKVEHLMKHSVDGLVVMLVGEEWEDIDELEELKVPIVTINYPKVSNQISTVLANDCQSVFEVMKYYITSGHRKIGYISAPLVDHSAGERFRGAEEAVKSFGDSKLEVYEGDYTKRSGFDGTQELLKKGVTALFVSN